MSQNDYDFEEEATDYLNTVTGNFDVGSELAEILAEEDQ